MIAVGIDISKSESTVAILSSTGELLRKPSEFRNDEQELNQLISNLSSYILINIIIIRYYSNPTLFIVA